MLLARRTPIRVSVSLKSRVAVDVFEEKQINNSTYSGAFSYLTTENH